jgi:hypothetical protein
VSHFWSVGGADGGAKWDMLGALWMRQSSVPHIRSERVPHTVG